MSSKRPDLNKRMDLNPYPSIQNVWARDSETNYKTLIEEGWVEQYLKMLKSIEWKAYEKIDGTNTRVIWNGNDRNPELAFRGRKGVSKLPPELSERLKELFTPYKMLQQFGPRNVILYGEGYGGKIQGGGGYGQPNFALFDVWFEESNTWARPEVTQDIAEGLMIKHAPFVCIDTLESLIKKVRAGLRSELRSDFAEGVVARPLHPLYDQKGNRVLVKIKTKDFRENYTC